MTQPAADVAAPVQQGSWTSILLIYGIGVLGAATITQALPVIGDLVKLFHAGAKAGWIISIPSITVALAAFLAGWLVDRFGDKPVLLVGSIIIVLGDIGVTAINTLQSLLTMRVLEGVGYLCTSVAAITMLTRITSGKRRNSALTLWSSYIPMSFALPLVLAGQLAGPDRWRWAFNGHAIVLGLLTVSAALQLPAGRNQKASRTAGMAKVIRMPGPWVLGLVFACTAFMQTGLVSILPNVLTRTYGVSFAIAASIGSLGMIFKTAGCLAAGPLLNRNISPITIALAGVILAILGGITLGLPLPSFLVAVVVSSVFFFGAGLVVGLWALTPTVAPDYLSLGAASGVVTQVAIWGVLLGPPAAFAAEIHGGWVIVSASIVLAAAGIMTCITLVVKRFTTMKTDTGQAAH